MMSLIGCGNIDWASNLLCVVDYSTATDANTESERKNGCIQWQNWTATTARGDFLEIFPD